jgi:hypothetical protein
MHECELGTWKALFSHLIRILYALPGGDQWVAKLDARYVVSFLSAAADEWLTFNPRHRFRQVPTFGNGVIRKFANNTSEMKKLAARDFEDILQVFLLLSICLHQVR